MATVYLSSATNSQMFTTCCEVAICDDQNICPKCRAEVTPSGHQSRWQYAYRQTIVQEKHMYGNHWPNHGL